MKLIRETSFNNSDFLVTEEKRNQNEPSRLTISGPYIVSEARNQNGRVYDKLCMENAVTLFENDMIRTCRSVGELNHPDSVEINFENACHLITELKQEGNVWVGKSRVLEGTPKGDILKGLLINGVKVGVSTRGVGEVDRTGLVSQYALVTVDVVSNPSAGNHGAFVNGIMESKTYMIDSYGHIFEKRYESLEKQLSALPLKNEERNAKIVGAVKEFLNSIK